MTQVFESNGLSGRVRSTVVYTGVTNRYGDRECLVSQERWVWLTAKTGAWAPLNGGRQERQWELAD